MKKTNYSVFKLIAILFSAAILFSNCSKDDEPDGQNILYQDTSAYTGELTVYTYYDNGSGHFPEAEGTNVFLYTDYDDIITDLQNSNNNMALFYMNTGNDNQAYFGFINMGNYYVLATHYINDVYYEKISIVQVRPRQYENLNITMIPVYE
mgnify:CR=1 FL=1